VAEEGSYVNLAVAERFEKTSILFGEVTGFSRWSVSRQPQQLFDLLEMVLRKLAKIAKELGVNLEVIGNCYVASVGIPDPRPDHAVIMALFAVECIRKVKELAIELTKSFGEGTKKLSFRAGLHNGDAVAGVLKGPGLSNRFHLFGPNVDLAVRLQQSASKGQARCSKATADELAAFDKSNWVLASSVPLQINGSAEVETYVLDQEVVDGLSSPSHTDLRLIDEEFEDEIRAAEMEMKRDDFGTCRL
jgi:class 3 adenylate cyclase